MTDLPPRARLVRILRALAAELPAQVAPLPGSPRFTDGFEALARLSDLSHAEAAARRMSPEEAGALADRLLRAWSRFAPVKLPPAAAIVAPPEIWVGPSPRPLDVRADVAGVDPTWEAVWEPPALPGPPSQRATILVAPPDGPTTLTLVAHVRARTDTGERIVLLAEAHLAVRAPVVARTPDARALLVTDHTGAPAAKVRVEADDQSGETDDSGLARFPSPVLDGAAIRVEGAGARAAPRPHP